MRRLHRRAHVVLWALLLPAALAALVHAWQSRRAASDAVIPDVAATETP